MKNEKKPNPSERAKRGRPPIAEVTAPQRKAFAAIRNHLAHRGFPPTVQELGELMGLGTSSAHELVSQLVRKGYLRREAGKARSLEVVRHIEPEVADLVPVPIVGVIAGGRPILAVENIVGEMLIDARLVRGTRCFALEVAGDSMARAGIDDGDYVIVRQQQVAENGDIVVALVGEGATVKRLCIADERIELRPENPRHRPIVVGPDDDLRIQGKVIGVRRRKEARLSKEM
ncbi:MAG: transcriptional repressor LexA [Deltaproteobacteria bacterium]|nr:transcriptional repressor LexA [Deltaproteobacteria bacterium]